MYITHDRMLELFTKLVEATKPSETPDDRYRPGHWQDRMYYIVAKVNGNEHLLSQIDWSKDPRRLAMDVASTLKGESTLFVAVEAETERVRKERFGDV